MAKFPNDLKLAVELDKLTDDLRWTLSEQYHVDDGPNPCVLRGSNEVMSMYIRQSEADSRAIASGLEAVVGPIRRKRAIELLDQIAALSTEIMRYQRTK